MPEENTRVVVTGAPKADKAFDIYDARRVQAERSAEEVVVNTKKLLGDMRRLRTELRRKGRR